VWIETAKQMPIEEAAKLTGMESARNGSLAPCPACSEHRRGDHDKRGPIGLTRDRGGWRCHRCGAGGDVVDLVSLAVVGATLRASNTDRQREIREWFADKGACTGSPTAGDQPVKIERPIRRPDPDELSRLWKASASVADAIEQAPALSNPLVSWLMQRNFCPKAIDKCNIARVAPPPYSFRWPRWFPQYWANTYRLLVPAFEVDGTFASVHVRSIKDADRPKCRWPYGVDSSGLLMMDPVAQKLLSGTLKAEIDAVLVCEGITDFLRAVIAARDEDARIGVISGTSGCFKSLATADIPDSIRVYIATDNDPAGDDYASEITRYLPNHTILRIEL